MNERVIAEVRGEHSTAIEEGPETPTKLLLQFGNRWIPSFLSAEDLTCALLDPDTGDGVVLISIAATDNAGKTVALHLGLTPDQARQRAAQLVQHANTLDQGKGKQ